MRGVLRCFLRRLRDFLYAFHWAFLRKEVFDPVWALYNIKAELGHLSAAHTPSQREATLDAVALYRAPVCQTVVLRIGR